MKETTRRVRAGVFAALIALLMLASAAPASADPCDDGVENITWELTAGGELQNITWESCGTGLLNVTWE